MNVCLNCAKFGACKLASENIKYCEKFQKQKYDLEIENYSKSERIDKNEK